MPVSVSIRRKIGVLPESLLLAAATATLVWSVPGHAQVTLLNVSVPPPLSAAPLCCVNVPYVTASVRVGATGTNRARYLYRKEPDARTVTLLYGH